MTIIKTEFALALNQVATERGIPVEEVLKSIEVAVLAAYKKEYPKEDFSKKKKTSPHPVLVELLLKLPNKS